MQAVRTTDQKATTKNVRRVMLITGGGRTLPGGPPPYDDVALLLINGRSPLAWIENKETKAVIMATVLLYFLAF